MIGDSPDALHRNPGFYFFGADMSNSNWNTTVQAFINITRRHWGLAQKRTVTGTVARRVPRHDVYKLARPVQTAARNW